MERKQPSKLDLVELEVTCGTQRLVGPVSFSLTRGECVVLSGQLGLGKSLLCEYLAGFRRPGLGYTGVFSFLDEAGGQVEGRVALVPQDWRLGALRTDQVRTILPDRSAEGPDWFSELEIDLDRIRHLGLASLASGERTRLLLACGLSRDADLIVVDGPGAVLDPRERGLLAEVMEAAIFRGKMLIVSARDQAPWADPTWRRVLIGAELGTEAVAVPLLQKRARPGPSVPTPPAVDVADLDVELQRRRFLARPKPALAVDGVSLFVRKGEILVLLGPSGSGKSTFLAAMAGLLPARAGRIRVSGVDVTPGRGRRPDALRRRIQLVSAEAARALDPSLSAGDHLERVITKGSSLRPEQWLDRLGLPPALADVQADYLSEGEGFRLSLALALCRDPRVVLLDTPRSGALDADGGTMTGLLLAEKAQGRTFVLATSDPGISRSVADRIAVLDAGRVVEFGPTSLVLSRPAHPRTLTLLRSEAGPPHDPRSPKVGCHLAGSCPRQVDRCQGERPALDFVPGATRNHRVACFNPNAPAAPPGEAASG
jgi:ABC-type glutathione transport system ATPase component